MLNRPPPKNKTFVRAKTSRSPRPAFRPPGGIPTATQVGSDVRNALLAGIGFWTGAVALGTWNGVFARLPGEVVVSLSAFLTAFAIAVVVCDARLRQWLDGRHTRTARLAVGGVAALVAVSLAGISGSQVADAGGAPWAPVLVLGVPLVAALGVAAAGAAWRRRSQPLRKAASTARLRRAAAT